MTSRHSHATVMLIGADEQLLRMITWILLEEGYFLWKCASVDEAIEHRRDLRPQVVLLDGIMGETKRSAALRVREAYPDSRVIELHAHGPSREDHCLAEGHLHKPFHADDLLENIEAVLAEPVGATSAHKHP
jgi:DNA-binding NtrC family response regulator